MKKKGLGKGLDALLGGQTDIATGQQQIPLQQLVPGRYQPRQTFDENELSLLADSIVQHGIIQPIVVRQLASNQFEIVAGERRFRAAQLAKVTTIPAIVRKLSDKEVQIFALVENLQRVDLNPIDQAKGLRQLIDTLELTHEQAGRQVGLSRSAITNLLRLNELNTDVQEMLEKKLLEMGHARALLPLPKSTQIIIARQIIAEQLSVRQTEALIRRIQNNSAVTTKQNTSKDADTERLEKALSEKLAMRVQFRHREDGSGQLILHYGSVKSLDSVIKKLRG